MVYADSPFRYPSFEYPFRISLDRGAFHSRPTNSARLMRYAFTRPSHEGYPDGGWRPKVMDMASISVVVLDPRIAPHNQATWAFTDGDDAMAMAGFLNTRMGGGEEIAWVEVVPLARKLNKKALRYLDCWAQLAEDSARESERGE